MVGRRAGGRRKNATTEARRGVRHPRSVPPVAKVEPITTARALRGPFDYLRPDGVGIGSVLVVPFGHRDVVGVVVGLAEESELADERLAEPRRVLGHDLPPELVELALWMADEYCSTPARALALVSPPPGARAKLAWWAEPITPAPAQDRAPTERQRALLAELPRAAGADLPALRRLQARGLVELSRRPTRRRVHHESVGARRPQPALTADQTRALVEIETAMEAPAPQPLLLHGVTGSGKTEVYLRAAATALARDRGVIVLVPEIALTPQIVSRFVDRFGDTVAVLHSKLAPGERHDEWSRLRAGTARVCVGPRSAVFAPIERLGLIVVDEEHDSSYKHEGDPRYDARHVADRRAAAGRRAARRRQRDAAARERPRAAPRPPARARRRASAAARADRRHARCGAARCTPTRATRSSTRRKAIVLLNRRGWSNFVDCRSCGHAWTCPHCDVSLVLHRSQNRLACHHCGHRERVPERCTECGSVSIARHGAGTERLEHDLAQVGHEVFRLDADVRDAGALLRRFEQAPRGILLGTQMVAKGHDFPDVTLGVVVDADGTLRFPDFRAEERTFALVAQLAGRAGRGPGGGRVHRPDAGARGRLDRRRRAPRRRRLPRRRARAPRGAALPAVLAPHPDRLLGGRPACGRRRRHARSARALGEIPGATSSARRRCFACAGASAPSSSSRAPARARPCARRAPPSAPSRASARAAASRSPSTSTRSRAI